MFDHNQESMNTHESDVKSEDSIHKNQKSLNYRKNELKNKKYWISMIIVYNFVGILLQSIDAI